MSSARSLWRSLGGLAALLFLALPSRASNTWYVDANAAPPGIGTLASPYADLQYAISRPTTVDGDTLLVLPGLYAGQINCGKALSIRSTDGALATRLSAANVYLHGGDSACLLHGFWLDVLPNAEGVVCGNPNAPDQVEDCVLVGQGGNGIRVVCDANVARCTILGFANGIEVAGAYCGTITLASCVLWGNTQHGVDIGSLNIPGLYDCVGQLSINPQLHVDCYAGDPELWNLAAQDYHPRPGSPCIAHDAGALPYDPTYAPDAVPYCSGKLTSQGCVPVISAFGHASASDPSPFWIFGDQAVDQRAGLLLYGFAQQANPFQGGTLCVAQFRRTPSQNSGGSGPCTGHWQFDMNARIQSGIDPALVPGKLVYGQWWGRDGADPAGFGSQLSGAIAFGIAP